MAALLLGLPSNMRWCVLADLIWQYSVKEQSGRSLLEVANRLTPGFLINSPGEKNSSLEVFDLRWGTGIADPGSGSQVFLLDGALHGIEQLIPVLQHIAVGFVVVSFPRRESLFIECSRNLRIRPFLHYALQDNSLAA